MEVFFNTLRIFIN